ncbi:MAG: HEAT repeat domain-containing protein [Sedimentisphaerales bacterium]|nr:HEAT repeat domain-containing protein [Sedimentisphaerales bacterium]
MKISKMLIRNTTLRIIRLTLIVGLMCLWSTRQIIAAAQKPITLPEQIIDCYISTGDNDWLSEWLPIDSKASMEASFDLLKALGIRRIYWRGLQEAAWLETMHDRQENCKYYSFWQWDRQLYKRLEPDKLAVKTAHKRGMEIWGVGSLADFGGPADSPCFNDYPHNSEAKFRLKHPEWVPTDKYGILKQNGPVEFAYHQARKTVIDLYIKHTKDAGYDGVTFLTYNENFSTRFQDEFGYNEPVVKDFKKRYGIDIRTEPFNRGASRFDWYRLRGEYVTQFLAELKQQLAPLGVKLGVVISSFQPHYPQPWNVSDIMLTFGHIYMDLETWVQQGIVDELEAYGYCSSDGQMKTIKDLLWMSRKTKTGVSLITSSPFAPMWKEVQDRTRTIIALGPDEMYLDYWNIPDQPLSVLKDGNELMKMKALSQIIYGKSKAEVADIAPLASHSNLLIRRMALKSLGKTKDPNAVPIIERGLEDSENCVRCVAALALRDISGRQSTAKLLATVDKYATHPLCEIVVQTLPSVRPAPQAELVEAVNNSTNPTVRTVVMRALVTMANIDLIETFTAGLKDSERYVRYAAAMALGNIHNSPQAVEVLIEATKHEDPVVSDRAAVSLGQIASQNRDDIRPLRPQILTALETLFDKLGDGCNRVDADWGYRSVGNALLAMGQEGEAVLEKFMDQKSDRRLAEQAWKVLYIRQNNNTFSEITEKENEQAFKKRPDWLNKAGKI